MRTRTMILTLSALIFSTTATYAQVTIGSDTYPQTTLDVVASKTDGTTAEGIMAPRLTLAQLKAADTQYTAAQTGALVYVTDATGGTTTKTANVTAAGYYYFDGTLWHSVSGVDNNTLYEISYESSTSLLTLTPTTGDGSPAVIELPKYAGSTSVTLESGNSFQRAALTGDATAAANSNATTVARIQGIPVSTTDPICDQILQYDGTNWTPATMALPMLLGTQTGNTQTINMADYTNTNVPTFAEVPFISYTLPPGRWLIFYYVPFKFNFTDTSIAQVSFSMGFASEDNSDQGTAGIHKFTNGAIVNGISHRDVMMGTINNTTSGNVKYTLRVGAFHFINNSGIISPVTNSITIMPLGLQAVLYAIGVK